MRVPETQPKHGRASSRGSQRFLDRAFVLRRFRYGESSLVVHVLSEEHGRQSILAKGAYRPKSGYCGVLDLFDTLELGWSLPRGAELGILSSGSILERRASIARRLDSYRAALSVLEIAGIGARVGHEEAELFRLLEQSLDALKGADAEPALVSAVFDLRFLQAQGLAPALEACASCGQRPPEQRKLSSVPFSPALGGRICSNCASQAGPEVSIESLQPATLRVASSLQGTPFSQLARIRLDPDQTGRLASFLRRFLEYHLETRPRVSGPRPRTQ